MDTAHGTCQYQSVPARFLFLPACEWQKRQAAGVYSSFPFCRPSSAPARWWGCHRAWCCSSTSRCGSGAAPRGSSVRGPWACSRGVSRSADRGDGRGAPTGPPVFCLFVSMNSDLQVSIHVLISTRACKSCLGIYIYIYIYSLTRAPTHHGGAHVLGAAERLAIELPGPRRVLL